MTSAEATLVAWPLLYFRFAANHTQSGNRPQCLSLVTPSRPLRKLRAAYAATSPTLTASSFQPGVLIGQKGNVRVSGAFLLFNGIDKANTGTAGLESLGDFEASPKETFGQFGRAVSNQVWICYRRRFWHFWPSGRLCSFSQRLAQGICWLFDIQPAPSLNRWHSYH